MENEFANFGNLTPLQIEAAGQAGKILSDVFLAFGRINFNTGVIDVVKRDPRIPAPPCNPCTADDYASMLLRENVIHPDYAEDYKFRSNAEHLQKVFFGGERLRTIFVRTNNPNGIEWINFGIAACENCSKENPWGAFYLMQEHIDMLPATIQRSFYETDSLTGVLSRTRYKADCERLVRADYRCLTCIYVDAIGLHELNNHLGHAKGDAMLKCIAHTLKDRFATGSVYRIGGDEFVCLLPNMTEQEAKISMEHAQDLMLNLGIEVSYGISETEKLSKLPRVIEDAETKMREHKRKFYESDCGERKLRSLNEGLEEIIRSKKDIENFVGKMVSDDTCVYVVNIVKDVSRCITAPEEVREYQHSGKDGFSDAMRFYAEQGLDGENEAKLMELVDYPKLREKLEAQGKIEVVISGLKGNKIKVTIMPYSERLSERDLTIWIFEPQD